MQKSIVLITGISRGIGLACALETLKRGHFVIGTTIDGSIPEELKPFSQNIKIIGLDLNSAQSIKNSASQLKEKKIDILINNAGVLLDEDNTSVDVDKLRATLEINLIGTIDFTEQALPFIEKNGHIVNISSMAGSLTDTDEYTHSHFPYHYPAYKISKCALNMYTRTLAMRLEKEDTRGIKVSSVHPGWVKTDLGGEEAPVDPAIAAKNIIDLAFKRPESGRFWFNGKSCAW